MPLKLNVGLSRKVGEANYGSRGATVNLELEVDSTLVAEPDRLQEHIRDLFGLAKSSIDEELQTEPAPPPPNGQRANGPSSQSHTSNRNGNSTNGNRYAGRRSANPPAATASQVRALHAIAKSQRLDLAALVRERFNLDQPEGLNIAEASELIDELKGTTSTSGGRR